MNEYQIATVWWPDGWEPKTPLDVPNCIGWAGKAAMAPKLTYEEAVASVRSLNRQNMDHPGATWHVVTQASVLPGKADTREVVIPSEAGGRGDCSHCPAHAFPCAAGSS